MTRLAPILLTLLAFTVAACDGDDAPTQSDAPTQREFAEQANEICRKAERSLRNVAEGAQTPQDIADAVDRVIEESRDTVEDLADLERPEGAAGERAERFVDTTRREIEEVGIPAFEELREAVERRDQEAAQQAADRLREIDTGASKEAARKVGADACAGDR
jgi:translation initiation factor 2B subunit (eIF-2B alpha/beta/delta family)